MSSSSELRPVGHAGQFLRIALIRRPRDVPGPALVAGLPQATLGRAGAITHGKRRLDFLWGRVLLANLLAASVPGARLVENPPKSPLVEESDRPVYTSISHTSTWIGATVASRPAAIDLEVVDSSRVHRALYERVLGDGAWERDAGMDAGARVLRFYHEWGLYECSVKLGGRHLRTASGAGFVLAQDGRCLEFSRMLGLDTLLTGASLAGVPELYVCRTDARCASLVFEALAQDAPVQDPM